MSFSFPFNLRQSNKKREIVCLSFIFVLSISLYCQNTSSKTVSSDSIFVYHHDSLEIKSFETIDTIVYYDNLECKSPVNLIGTKFNSDVFFRKIQFDSTVYFSGTSFNSPVDFSRSEFKSPVYFNSANFDSIAFFDDVVFDDVASFYGTKLPKVLSFKNVVINQKEIDLSNVSVESIPGRRCNIYLKGTDLNKLNIRYDMFKLIFDEATPFDEKSNVYEKLLKRTADLGYKKSYELLDKDYKEEVYLEKSKGLINWLDKNWWGYGYNKELIPRNTAILFLFFSIINCIFFRHLSINLYEVPRLFETRNRIMSDNKILLFFKVLPLAVFYTGFIFFGLRLSVDRLKYFQNLSGWRIFYLVYFFIIYLSGLICIGYMANYILSS